MSIVKNDSLGGIPPDVNMQMLNRFENSTKKSSSDFKKYFIQNV
jgi:hypothetical protein